MSEQPQDTVASASDGRTALVVGASRGIGLGLVREYLRRGWTVVATAREYGAAELEALAAKTPGRLRVERVDIAHAKQISALSERLTGETLDVLFVNAGINHGDTAAGEVSTDSFDKVMLTNALGPMRVIEALQQRVRAGGTIAAMSSREASIALNEHGGYDVYRASKSALNQLMRCFAARHDGEARTLMLISPGWVRTDLGGSEAPLLVEDCASAVLDLLELHPATGTLSFRNLEDEVVPW